MSIGLAVILKETLAAAIIFGLIGALIFLVTVKMLYQAIKFERAVKKLAKKYDDEKYDDGDSEEY